MKDQKIELPELPSWHEAERNCLFDAETPLDRFIFDNEPSECDDEWRQQLSAVMRESIAPYAKRIAELESERQRRGEPIGVEITALIANMAAFLEVSGDPYADPLIKHAREVLSAPQPAEPVIISDIRPSPHPLPSPQAEPVNADATLINEGTKTADSVVRNERTTAEPVKHPSYDTDCCQGHEPESTCKCAAHDAAEPVKMPSDAQLKEFWRQLTEAGGDEVDYARALLSRHENQENSNG